MQQALIDSIKASPAYRQLVTSRRRFSFTLTALMIFTYYGFILFVALFVVIVGILTDVVYTLLDPRVDLANTEAVR